MFTSWGQILWPLDYRFALKQSLCRSALHYSACHCIDYGMENKRCYFAKKYITKGLFISFLSAFILFCKTICFEQFEKALNKQGIHYSEIIVKPTAFNIILWNANVATTASYLLADYSH
jgi:inner membrane protein